ncbi:MAG TPA: hypothetical protein DEG17_13520 [Cyanobacteria bacterium UBA11149]|nr:hypothetical protein [Cyanobacteria bacterium UBA11367]HBE57529.1 hypothetical protein [Cyanobacteria bacterium UBA11366]HBK62563.1 hypothetical protein [Cyanobacteria bacterium UBA11166]HBR74975.1 hypothetical protein [Cyanobacteria bacterium UBA11159]HBS69585.1 hypothetical protein [Cyanobacteria bacterium UBA11153]HBW89861.1 hypothetical protein [Cyanobacteria bacterium UBA11149]HCA94805.1 hypothetical protein [Cyanobacteria bacterium UBA9226]
MSSHFSLKSLLFYGTAISSVVVLFKIVTAYGNTNLKANPPIDGYYPISSENLPDCLKSESLGLNLLQSGVYINGTLLSGDTHKKTTTSIENNPSLSGQFINREISLTGKVPWLTNCDESSKSGNHNLVKIQGIIQGDTIAGKISLNNIPGGEFTATKELQKEEETNKH